MIDDERAREGLDHLQSAALEAIAATRAFLDVAEDLVREPGALGDVLRALQAMAAASMHRDDAAPGSRGADDRDAGAEPPPVRRIHVS